MFENCVYDASGAILCTYKGLPFQCSEEHTREQWAQLQDLIADEEVTVAPYVPPVPPSAAEIIAVAEANARKQRDALVSQSDWVVNRHRDQIDSNVATSLTPAQYQTWLVYRQALRDISKQSGWPSLVQWPTQPPAASDDQAIV